MLEHVPQEFPHEALEADMRRLAEEIERHRDRPESRYLSHEQLLKTSLRSLTQVAPKDGASPPASSPLPAYAADLSSETKLEIEYLLDLAFHKGIAKAVEEARKSNPFIMDVFHDALAGKLYPELERRGAFK